MTGDDVLALLDGALAVPAPPTLLEVILDAACLADLDGSALAAQLNQLIDLRARLPESAHLERVLCKAVTSSVPLAIDGFFPAGASLVQMCAMAEKRWKYRSPAPLDRLDIGSFLRQTTWITATVQIIVALLYRSASARPVFAEWLSTEDAGKRSAGDMAHVMNAYLDAVVTRSERLAVPISQAILTHLKFLLSGLFAAAISSRGAVVECLAKFMQRAPVDEASELMKSFHKRLSKTAVGFISCDVLVLGLRLTALKTARTADSLEAIAEKGLQWAVRYFTGEFDAPEDGDRCLEMLGKAVRSSTSPSLTSRIR